MGSDGAQYFSPDYTSARERFRAASQRAGAELSGHAIGARSARGGELSIDTAYLGPDSPAGLLILSSGLHGVEGFTGSAIQCRLLSESLLALPRDCGLLLVHALNPFGFSERRRVNENNVDLNRNFVAHPEGHVENPGYEELYEAINPETLDEELDASLRARLFAYAEEHGAAQLQAVLTQGQYRHPQGMQFGGERPEDSNRLARRIAREQTRDASRIVWIDLHTGLGPRGEVELISESHPDAADFRRARAIWGDAVCSTASGESVSAALCGTIERGLAQELPDRELTAVAAEFGTCDPVRVFLAMRADNWLHVYGELESEAGRAIKSELLEVFRPADPAWRARVLEAAAAVLRQAGDALAPPRV